VVDIASGSDRAFDFDRVGGSAAPGVGIVQFSAAGIYLTEGYDFSQGLWLMDPTNGAIHKVLDRGYPEAVDGGTLWQGEVNPADPKPYLVVDSGYAPDEVDRIDLRDGTKVTWLYRPGWALGVVGLDAIGRPIILAYSDPDQSIQLLSMEGPDRTRVIYTFVPKSTSDFGYSVTDVHGTWFGGQLGVFLYSSQGVHKVSDAPVQPAGPCR
jgi:hypothetical protein